MALTMLIGSGIAPVFATPNPQGLTITGESASRNPILGDPGSRTVNPHWTAQQWAQADRQNPGTMNGNQPDRAEAGGGGR